MKINKGIAVAVAALSIVGLAACGNSNAASGTTDTKADKGLDVIGNTITYDPNHLVNDGKPIQLEYWSWGSKGTDPVYKMIESYTKTYPNVTIKTVNVSWDDYWTKLPLALKGKNGPAVFNIHNSYDALIRPYAADYDIDTKSLESDYSTASVHEDENGKVKYIDSVSTPATSTTTRHCGAKRASPTPTFRPHGTNSSRSPKSSPKPTAAR